jgi:Carboxypeptidase regulatory-like domain
MFKSERSLTRWATTFVEIIGVIVLASSLVWGQGFSAAISGVVRDPTGAVLPGVSVTAKHIESGLTRTVNTNETGGYSMPSLPVGAYEVTAELMGFKQQVRRGINLAVTQEAVVNLTLDVGDLKEQVTVTEEVALVNTTLASTSGLVTGEQIKSLPLNGRSFLELMTLNPGVITNRSNTNDNSVPSFSIAGKRPDSNRFTMNGMDYVGNNAGGTYTAPQGISGFLLGVDAVREFNVLGHTYGAEYGKRAGAQVTIVTTSGTNQWRGSVFEYLRNSALDTRNFFDVANAPNPTPVPQFQRNQFGGAVGGPVRKDKMFFFGNYEGFRERLAVSQFGYVPSSQVRQGLWPNAAGQYVQAPNLEQRILPFFRYWPEPNGPELLLNGLPTGTARYSANPKRSVQEDFGLGRFDYYLSTQDSVNGNFTADKGNRSNPQDPTFLVAQETNLYTLSTQETHIFSPTLVNVANFGYSSARTRQKAPPVTPFPDGLLFLSGGGRNNPGSIVIGGGTVTVGASALIAPNGQNLNYNARRNFSVSDDLKLTKGIHSFSFGAWFQRVEQTAFSSGQNNAGTVSYPTLLAFLQDRPTQFNTQTKPTELIFSSKQAAWYFQDEMKLRPNLTVRLGLRDEMTTLINEKNGHSSNYLFDANGILMTDPFIGKTPLIENHAKALLQPRVGLAWDVTGSGTWAVRAGFGIHNDLQDNLANRLNANPPFSGRLTIMNQPLLSIIPISAEVAPPPACKFVGQTNPPCSVYAPGGIDPVLRTPTLQQWSLTVEHQLAQDLVAEAEYVGSQSYHVSTTMDVNTIQPLKCADPAGCPAGGILAPNQRSVVPLGTVYVPVGSRPNPLLGSSQGWYYVGTSSYHAMSLSLLKRARGGLTFKSSYTWGKVLDINSANLVNAADNEPPTTLNRFDRKFDKGPASFSLLHQFNTNFSYALPFGNGKAFGSGATGWVDKLIGGWQWNGIFVANSGFPITPQVGSNRSGTGDTGRLPDRPSLNPNFKGNPILGVKEFKKTGRYFDPNAFLLPMAGTFGNAGRGQFRGPGFFNVDTSFFKRIPLKERLNLQFRTEVFNLLNHANFDTPNLIVFAGTDVSPTAGVLTGTSGSGNGRQIQFALRLEF